MDWLLSVAGEAIAAILAVAVTAALGWVASSIRGLGREIERLRASSDERLDRAEGRLVKVEELERHNVIERLGKCESQIASLVTAEDVTRIHARIDELQSSEAALAAGIGEVKGLVESQSKQLGIIQQHLLERGA